MHFLPEETAYIMGWWVADGNIITFIRLAKPQHPRIVAFNYLTRAIDLLYGRASELLSVEQL